MDAQRHEIQREIAGLHRLPALPRLARELLRARAARGAALDELAAAAAFDRALCRALIDAAGAQPGAGPVRDAGAALARLGLGGARKAVFRALAHGLFPPEGGRNLDRRAFWRHAACTAAYAERIARRVGSAHVDDAYVAGLLHDIGRPVLDVVRPGAGARALAMGPGQGIYLLEAERRAFGVDHTLAGKWLAEAWDLPEPFRGVIWLHHHPPAMLEHTGGPVELIEIVALAETLATARLSGLFRPQALPAAAEAHRKRLGLDADALAQILASAPPDLGPPAAAAAEPAPPAAPETPQSVARALRRHEAVGAFLLNLAPGASPGAVVSALADALRATLGAAAGCCLAVDPAAGMAEGVAWRGGAADRVRLGAGGDAGRKAIAALVADPGGAAEAGPTPEPGAPDTPAPGAPPLGGLLCLPMLAEGAQVGLIALDTAGSPLRGDAEDIEDVALFARAGAAALARAAAARGAEARAEGLATALWKAELGHRQAVRAERLASVGKMAAGAAHEINNPLAIIAGKAQLLLSRERAPEDARALESIVEQTRRASKVLADLLKFARPGEPQRQPTLMNSLAHQVVDAMRDRLEAARVRVEEDYAPGLPRVRVDRRQMEQVLVNLILNAEQAMPGGGQITLRLRPAQDRQAVVMQVSDTGPGIPADALDRVFEPFFTTRQDRGGTGLGLSVCHGIVEAHRGGITLHSAAGGGTTCTVTLPVDSDDAVDGADPGGPVREPAARDTPPPAARRAPAAQGDPAPPAAAQATGARPERARDGVAPFDGIQPGQARAGTDGAGDDAPGGAPAAAPPAHARVGEAAPSAVPAPPPAPAAERRPATVLIVDDDEDLRLVLREALEGRGYAVRTAEDGLEGLATLLSERVDVLLLDLHVPNLDGISLLRQARERGIKPATLILNALATNDEIAEAMRLGARRAVQKPFEIARLFAELDAALGRRSVA